MINMIELSKELTKIVNIRNELRLLDFVFGDPKAKKKFDELTFLLEKEGTTDSLEELLKYFAENKKILGEMVNKK